jgi:hypothetical protein
LTNGKRPGVYFGESIPGRFPLLILIVIVVWSYHIMSATFESAVLEENFSPDVEAPKPMPVTPDWLEDYWLTPDEFRVYCYVVKRALLNGKCDDSVPAIALACRVARNVVLSTLHNLSEVYQLLVKNKRPGLTDEYSIAPHSQWAEPILPEDRVLTRRKISTEETDQSLKRMSFALSSPIQYSDINLVEAEELFEQSVEYHQESTDQSIKRMGDDSLEPIQYSDTNVVEAEEIFEQSVEYQEDEVCGGSVTTAAASIWRRNPDATRYCQIPPIHNQSVGVEIQRQMSQEGLTAQAVVERAIAFSKVPKLILGMLLALAQKLADVYNSLMQLFPQRQNTQAQHDSCDSVYEFS